MCVSDAKEEKRGGESGNRVEAYTVVVLDTHHDRDLFVSHAHSTGLFVDEFDGEHLQAIAGA